MALRLSIWLALPRMFGLVCKRNGIYGKLNNSHVLLSDHLIDRPHNE